MRSTSKFVQTANRNRHTSPVVDFIRPTWSITTPVKVSHRIVDKVLARGARTPGGAFRRAYAQHREEMYSSPNISVFSEVRR